MVVPISEFRQRECSQMHERFMQRAIQVARRNPTAPFGALLVDIESGEIGAEGVNRGHENPIWHGEIDVINRFSASHPDANWARFRLYTTAEPCCMCQAAALWSGIQEVVYGTSIVKLQQLGWRQIDIRADEVARRTPFARCKLVGGILEQECDQLFRAALELS